MFEDAKPRRVEVPINTRADLVEEHSRLEEELRAALSEPATDKPKRMSSSAAEPAHITDLARQIEALEEEMDDSWVTFVLQPRPKAEWRKFRTEHPATEADDTYAGVDTEAVLHEFVPKCVIEPKLSDDDWQRALDDDAPGIWPGDQERLKMVVFGFYMATFDAVPKSPLLSAVTQTSGEQQEQLEASVFPGAASKGGSRRSGTSTTRMTGRPAAG